MSTFPIDVVRAAERSTPGTAAGFVKVYTKDVAGLTQAFALLGNGTEAQLTPLSYSAGSVTPALLDTKITFGPRTLVNQAAAQNVFSAGTLTLTAGMTYKLRGRYVITFPTTTSSVSGLMSFAGTATYTRFDYTGMGMYGNVQASATNYSSYAIGGNGQYNFCLATNTTIRLMEFDGIVIVNAGGTFIPQVAFSGAPGQVPTLTNDSYLEMTPLGAGFASQGGWG